MIADNIISECSYGVWMAECLPVVSSNALSHSTEDTEGLRIPFVQEGWADPVYSNNILSGTVWPTIGVVGSVGYDTSWEDVDNLPYTLLDDVTIDSSAVLTVAPSVVVKFKYESTNDYKVCLFVNGLLDAQGSPGNEVIFTSMRDDSYGGDSNGDDVYPPAETSPTGGDWGYIKVANGASDLHDCLFRYGGYKDHGSSNYYNYMVWVNNSYPSIRDCTFEHCFSNGTNLHYYGYQSGPTSPEITGNTITGGSTGIHVIGNGIGTTPSLIDNVIHSTSAQGLHCTGLVEGTDIRYNALFDNSIGLYLESGYGDVHNSNFIDNESFAVSNVSGTVLSATDNYWGSPTGPSHPSNPDGEGDQVSDDVDFVPYASGPFDLLESPKIAIHPSTLYVELFPGEAQIDTLLFENIGEQPLSFQTYEATRGQRTNVPWLSVDPISGTIPGGAHLNTEVMFVSSDLEDDTYLAALVVESNDPENSLVVVPVTMDVNHVFLRGPAFGDTLMVGQEYAIHWDLEDEEQVQSVDLSYSTDGGLSYPHEIAVGIPPSDPFEWSVSEPLGDECLLKILAHFIGGDDYEDISSGFFTIVSDPTQVEDGLPIQAVTLSQNFPNPFNPKTTFSFALPDAAIVKLEVYDLSGALVARVLPLSRIERGHHTVEWIAEDPAGRPLASGVYLFRLQSDHEVLTRKLILLK